jgi:DNA repair protein RadD
VFRDLVHYTQIGALFDDDFLCPVKYKQVTAIDHGRLKINSTGADWTDRSVQRHLDEIRFADRLTEGVKRLLAAGRHAIVVFTRFTAEAEALARSLGAVAAVVTAKTPARQRDAILDDFKAGRIKVVANVGIIALGFDFPRLDTVVLARPTRSLALYYQQVGRAIRLHPEKPWAAVVDMVGLVDMFGRIEDMELRPGGARGQKWSIWSGDRQLTNVHF